MLTNAKTPPNVAKNLVQWTVDGMPLIDEDFIEKSSNTVDILRLSD